MKAWPTKHEEGFTLVEFLVALAITGIMLTAISWTFLLQRNVYDAQEEITEMVENARATMDILVREVRLAGLDPSGAGIVGVPYSTSQLELYADLDGDGTTTGPNEHIVYTFDSTNKQVKRNVGAGAQPLGESIEAFQVSYLDGNGNTTTTSANIRRISIMIRARTSKPDPDYSQNGGYRTHTLTTLVTPVNLGL